MAAVHANKRNKWQREADKLKVAEMYKTPGVTQSQIGKELNLSQGQISLILASIRQDWRAQRDATFDQKVQAELEEIDGLEIIYYEQWLASLKPIVSTTIETKAVSIKTPDDNGNIVELPAVETKTSKRTTQTNGDKDFLDGVKWCVEQRLKIIGGYAATKSELTGKDGGPVKIEQSTKPDLSKLSLEELLQLRQMMSKATDGITEPA